MDDEFDRKHKLVLLPLCSCETRVDAFNQFLQLKSNQITELLTGGRRNTRSD